MPGTTPRGVLAEKYVPFTAFLKADPPATNKRQELTHWYEVHSTLIEEQLDGLCATAGGTFDYSKPIAYTVQFGDKTPRFTINGHACRRETFTNEPTQKITKDYDNKIWEGYSNTNEGNEVPSPELNTIPEEVRLQLEASTGLPVIRLKIAGYIYGYKGTTIP